MILGSIFAELPSMFPDLFLFDPSLPSDPFSPFINPPIDHDIFQVFSEIYNYEYISSSSNNNDPFHQNPVDETSSFDQISSTSILSSSPPSNQLENLSLCQTTQLAQASDSADFSVLDVKTEECQAPFDSLYGYRNSFVPHNYGGSAESAAKIMQRSYSSNSFYGKTGTLFQPRFGSLIESPNFQTKILSSSKNKILMRRACSTGDLQKMKTDQRLSSSPLATKSSFIEEANFKVGRYSAQERKERIHRYRAKRNQRNFNKKIKYACRKTLADNRPRIRGRFARNDEAGETPKAAIFNRCDDEDDLWIDGLPAEDEDGMVGGGTFLSNYSSNQFQYQGH